MNVRAIRAPNPGPLTLQGTNTYVVDGVVIDPGPNDERHLKSLLSASPVRYIVLTHCHSDHAGGAKRLSELTGASTLVFGEGLEDGAQVAELTAIHTPGHSPDHLCFWHARSGTLFSGDLIAGTGSILVAPPEGDLAAYVASLERIRTLNPSRILPAHGPEIPQARAKIEEYLAHRREREARVIAAIQAGAASVGEIAEIAYADVPPSMRPYAELAVQAHLDKIHHRPLQK
jgi:glyoxylase-like metal-dependent hydrolase (beta-lactamase superfamily II)